MAHLPTQIVKRLWIEDDGFVVSSELILMAVIVCIGMIAGTAAIRDSVAQELGDVATAIGELDQSYSFGAVTTNCGTIAGSEFVDTFDFCQRRFPPSLPPIVAIPVNSVNVCAPATSE